MGGLVRQHPPVHAGTRITGMGLSYRAFRLSTARYPTVRPAVVTQLREAAADLGIEMDTTDLTGEQTNRLFSTRYEWQIEPTEGAYRVSETQFISDAWFLLTGATLVLFLVLLLRPSVVGAIVLIGLLAIIVLPLTYTTPVRETSATSQDRHITFAGPIVSGLFLLLVLLTAWIMWIASTTVPSLWPLVFLVILAVVVMLLVFWNQPSPFEFEPEHLPEFYDLFLAYVSIVILGLTPICALIGFPRSVQTHPLFQAAVLLVSAVSVVLLWLVYRLLSLTGVGLYHQFLKGEETVERRFTRRVLVGVLLTTAAGTVVIVGLFVDKYAAFFTGVQPLTAVLIGMTLLPLAYVGTGLALQTATFLRDTVGLFRHSAPTTILTPGDIDAQIRELKTADYRVGCYSLGGIGYIFVSTGLLRALDPDELEAVLAHEAGHIEHGDAFLSFLIPIAAIFLFAGKNVLYTILDFRTREFDADAYAAEHVGAEPLARALATLESLASEMDDEQDVRTAFSATPTFVSFSRTPMSGFLDRYFGTYFGNFALTEAHPDVEERINVLDNR